MELRHLRSFVAAAEEQNISRAAARAHLTQPALSRQIKTLEGEVGVQLFERGAHSIKLTEAGEAMLREAREVLARAGLALERVRAVASAPHLRVGFAPTLAAGILAVAIEAFMQKHSRVRLELLDLSTVEMLERLTKGTLDAALTVTSHGSRGVTWTKLLTENMHLAMRRDHPLAAQAVISPAALDQQHFVVLSRKEYPEYWQTLTSWFRRDSIKAKVTGEYDGISSLISAVEAGLGVALVGERSARAAPDHVLVKALAHPPQPTCVGVGVTASRASDKVLAVFIEELRRAAKVVEANAGRKQAGVARKKGAAEK